jgi:hypothetical protein
LLISADFSFEKVSILYFLPVAGFEGSQNWLFLCLLRRRICVFNW